MKSSLIIGLGLAITPIHNKWLTDLLTLPNGNTLIFLPAIGTVLWLLGSLLFITKRWQKGDSLKSWLGDWKVYIPLFVIALFMGLSGFKHGETLSDKFAPLLLGFSFIGAYVVGRKLGASLFKPLIPFVILGAVISVVMGILNPGLPASEVHGLITNYAASAGFLIVGATFNQGKKQWVLLLIALIGVFFIGAIEAALIVAGLGIIVILRRDSNKYFWVAFGVVIVLVLVWFVLGYLVPLYTGNNNLQELYNTVTGETDVSASSMNNLTSGRWGVYLKAIQDIKFFGHGYSQGTVSGGIVHNVPLIIVHQIGLIPAVAWLFVTLYCLIKTKWKYAWALILVASVWDHWLWTQFAPYWWVLVGVSTTSEIKSDLIFRREDARSSDTPRI